MNTKPKQACLAVGCKKLAEPDRRGLCEPHYQRFNRGAKTLSPEDRAEYEEMLIKEGRLLPSRKGKGNASPDDQFDAALKRFKSFKKNGPDESNSDDTPGGKGKKIKAS